jgi:hypothetical protein
MFPKSHLLKSLLLFIVLGKLWLFRQEYEAGFWYKVRPLDSAGFMSKPVSSESKLTTLENNLSKSASSESKITTLESNLNVSALSPSQTKWREFELNIGRKAVYVTGRFHRKVGKFEATVKSFTEQIIASGLPASRIFSYADTFPDFILEDPRWKRHVEFLTDAKSPTKRGAGYWFWKAPLIQHHLSLLNEGDFLFYADADIGHDGDLQDMDGLIRTMVERGHNLATWRYNDNSPCCPEGLWNKRDVYDYYCPHRNQTMDFSGQFHAAWMLIEKTPATLNLIDEYVKGVSNFHFVSDEPSNLENIPAFRENRHDQSILSLIIKCRYLENGMKRFNPMLPGKKLRIRMLSIADS